MLRELEAVYENGVLRPLEPLALAEQQHVLVTVSSELRPWRRQAEEQLAQLGPAPGLDVIRERLSHLPTTMAETVIQERGER